MRKRAAIHYLVAVSVLNALGLFVVYIYIARTGHGRNPTNSDSHNNAKLANGKFWLGAERLSAHRAHMRACRLAYVSRWVPNYMAHAQAYVAQFTRELVYANYNARELVHHKCAFEVFSLVPYAHRSDFDTVASFVTPVYVEEAAWSRAIVRLARRIRAANFTAVVVQFHRRLAPNMWQLVDLVKQLATPAASVLSLNSNLSSSFSSSLSSSSSSSSSLPVATAPLPSPLCIYAVMHAAVAYPDLELLGVVRNLARHATHLVALTWHSYYSLVHAYGIDERRLLLIPHGVQAQDTLRSPASSSLAAPPSSSPAVFSEPSPRKTPLEHILLQLKDTDFVAVATGFVNPSKGLHRVVRSLKQIVTRVPNFRLVVAGPELHEDSSASSASGDGTSVLANLTMTANALGLGAHVLVCASYLSKAEMQTLHARANIYLTLHDESEQPVSTTLLVAVAHMVPIVSTPHRFALEYLSQGRASLVPFEDDRKLAEEISLLANSSAAASASSTVNSQTQANAAYAFVQYCTWQRVANQYGLMLTRSEAFGNDAERRLFNTALLPDQFRAAAATTSVRSAASEQSPLDTKDRLDGGVNGAFWSNQDAVGFDGRSLFESWDIKQFDSSETISNKNNSMFALYADASVQLNARLDLQARIETLGLKARNHYIVIDRRAGIDAFRLRHNRDAISQPSDTEPGLKVDYPTDTLTLITSNVELIVQRQVKSGGEVTVNFTAISRFAHAYGLLGCTVRRKYDQWWRSQHEKAEAATATASAAAPPVQKPGADWDEWRVTDNDLFSSMARGQVWPHRGSPTSASAAGAAPASADIVESNAHELAENELAEPASPSAATTAHFNLIIHGQLLTNSGFAAVNRRMYLELIGIPGLGVLGRADTAHELRAAERSAQVLCAHSLLLRQQRYVRSYARLVYREAAEEESLTVSFRNNYPPDRGPRPPRHGLVVLQQPWEYYGVPAHWAQLFADGVDEVWVPSAYNRDAFVANGLPGHKIHVVPHGVDYDKFQLPLSALAPFSPLLAPARSRFRFLTVGGLLARKGLDVLLDAYTAAFSARDAVTLVIHCIYRFYGDDKYIRRKMSDARSPEIVYMQEPLSELDLVRLYRSADVYVTPYRSEGFGITMLEAMAAGLPLIVTRHGPALELCAPDATFFVDANVTACRTYPCGAARIFKFRALRQPMWAEPSVVSLTARLREARSASRERLRRMAELGRERARNYSWPVVMRTIRSRLTDLVARKRAALSDAAAAAAAAIDDS